MGTDEEFTEYVAARWPRLVRSAVLLGCAPAEAEDVVQTALTRCLTNWAKVRRADDRDAYVHRVLINTFTSSRRRRWSGSRRTSGPASCCATTPTSPRCRWRTCSGLRPGTVKSRLSRALKVLAEDPNLADLRGTP